MEPLVRDKVTGNYASIVERSGDEVRLDNPYVRLGWRKASQVEVIAEEARKNGELYT